MTRNVQADPRRIDDLTDEYETWLRKQTTVVKHDLLEKHRAMCESPFPFLRATYYAWAVMWPMTLPELLRAPRIAAIGDLHMENFGTWRDAEGRLAWGVNDFDEAARLPYTNDLVRLATSAALAYETARLRAPGSDLAEAFLSGYRASLKDGGRPIVFADQHKRIGKCVLRDLIRPQSFWKEKMPGADVKKRTLPPGCRNALEHALPQGTTIVDFRPRVAGVGSLGRPRFVAIGHWNGGLVAREAKAVVPSAALWASGHGARPLSGGVFERLLGASIRSRDPFLHRSDGWVVRRLAPDTDKIEIASLGRKLELKLATLMGNEVANVHLATPGAADAILADLANRRADWLVEAARVMTALVVDSHKAWKRGNHGARCQQK
jgi:hypothetical protein